MTLTSDKFTFPDGNTQPLTLDRPTTSVRVTAQARTSGDRLPIEVTLHTPDGQLLIAHTVLTVHSTAISFVGVALTVLAGAVLLVWWVRTWRRSRRRPPAGALTVAAARRARTLPLRTSAAYVAVGTGVSRVTGLLRFVALAWALGQTLLADSYNLANTTPNMLYDVVLGGVLSATFIPVFVDRLANKTEREAFESISAVLTVSVVVLLVTTVAALVAAPVPHRRPHRARYARAAPTRSTASCSSAQVATTFLRWFVIQIAAYGLFALGAALLNTRRRFVAVAWAPDRQQPRLHRHPGLVRAVGRPRRLAGQRRGAPVPARPARASGTSLGVVLQGVALDPEPAPRRPRAAALALEPPRRRAARRGPPRRVDLRLRGGQPDRPLRRHHPGRQRGRARPGVVVHLRLRLLPAALRHHRGDRHVGGHARPGRALVDRAADRLPPPHDAAACAPCSPSSSPPPSACCCWPSPRSRCCSATATAPRPRRPPPAPRWPCSPSGCPGFCTYLYLVRVLQSMQRTKVAFYLYLVENALNIVLAARCWSTRSACAASPCRSPSPTPSPRVLALAVFRQWFGRLAEPRDLGAAGRVVIAAVPMAVVVLVVSNLSGSTTIAGAAGPGGRLRASPAA